MEQIIKNDLAWEHEHHNYGHLKFNPSLTLKCSECFKEGRIVRARVEARKKTYSTPDPIYSINDYKING